MDLNSPRMPSGASGLLSHMSMVAGPPASHSRMTLLAFALSSVSFFAAAFAWEARKPGSVRPRNPADPMVSTSRRWNPSQSVRDMAAVSFSEDRGQKPEDRNRSQRGEKKPRGTFWDFCPLTSVLCPLGSVVQNELARIDQRPDQVGDALGAGLRVLQ